MHDDGKEISVFLSEVDLRPLSPEIFTLLLLLLLYNRRRYYYIIVIIIII